MDEDEIEWESSEVLIPAFNCPACGGQTQKTGQDELEPTEECDDCGVIVRIVR